MSLFDDIINYELCFPGAVTGSTQVQCPQCSELLTVPVDDPPWAKTHSSAASVAVSSMWIGVRVW